MYDFVTFLATRFSLTGHSWCKSVHRVNVISGRSLFVDKLCVMPQHCQADVVGCHDTDVYGVQVCNVNFNSIYRMLLQTLLSGINYETYLEINYEVYLEYVNTKINYICSVGLHFMLQRGLLQRIRSVQSHGSSQSLQFL